MKKSTALLLLLPAMAACEIDLSGLDFGGFTGLGWGDCCYSSPTTVIVQGAVTIGPFQAMDREVTVELFDPANPSILVAAAVSSFGQYALDLGTSPSRSVCSFHLRGVLWNGEITPPQPLFDAVPNPCALAMGSNAAAPLNLLAYEPLIEPFGVEGMVFIDGHPAGTEAAVVALSMRSASTPYSSPGVPTDAYGRYRLETHDAAQRFAWCSQQVSARVRDAAGRIEDLWVGDLPQSSCSSGRALPDARIGTLKAAAGNLYHSSSWAGNRYLGAGEAWAELIRVEDGTVGERFATLEDGSFHVWFPHGVRDPGCGWVLRVTLASGPSDVRELFGGGACQGLAYHAMTAYTFSTPFGAALALTVEDPMGDNTGLTDLTGMTLRFDPGTGIYELVLVADAAQPFQGEFRVNINLFNPARQSLLDDTVNDFRLETPTTTLRLSGYNRGLRSWLPGDEVHTNSLRGTPNPPGTTLFRSGIAHFPMSFGTNEDVIAFADLAKPAVVVTAGP